MRLEADRVACPERVLVEPDLNAEPAADHVAVLLATVLRQRVGRARLRPDGVDDVDEVDLVVGCGVRRSQRTPPASVIAVRASRGWTGVVDERAEGGLASLKRSPTGMPSSVAIAQSVATDGVARPRSICEMRLGDTAIAGCELATGEPCGLPFVPDPRAERPWNGGLCDCRCRSCHGLTIRSSGCRVSSNLGPHCSM